LAHAIGYDMARLLLLMSTTTYRAHDFLAAAQRLGIDAVIGSDQQQVLAELMPGRSLMLDFLQPAENVQNVVAFAEQHPLDAIVAVDDDGALLAAMASELLNLPHNSADAVAAARNKYLTRQLLAQADLPSPFFRCYPIDADPTAIARDIPFPCVVKPLFLSASRGVIRADDATQLAAAFKRVGDLLRRPEIEQRGGPLAHQILIESFIPGREVALEGILIRGDLKVLALFDKPDPLDGPFFEETLYVTPSRLPVIVQAAIASRTAQAAEALGLRQGPIHAELRVQHDEPWILEVAPRSLGGTLRFGPGLSLEELILQQALGIDPTQYAREHLASGVMMLPIPRRGTLQAVRGRDNAQVVPGIEELDITIPLGQEVIPLPEGDRYLGFLFARADTPQAVEAALRRAHRQLDIVIT
jgi:biotin carboxylase